MKMQLNLSKKIFNKVYLPYLYTYNNRVEVYYGGSGSGKSHFVVQKLIIKALASKRKVLVVRKVMATHRESTWQLILDILSQFKILSFCKVNKTNFTITLPNGSVFTFRGMDDAEKIKSITGVTDIWCEEASELSLEDFTQLDLRLRAKVKYLQILLSFNPISKANWTYKHFFGEEAHLDNALIIKTTYKDNKFLPDSYIKALEAMIKTNPTYYKIYALGEYATLDKLVFNNWRVDRMEAETVKDWPMLVGLDFGYVNDITALVKGYINEESKTIYIDTAIGRTGLLNEHIYALIESLGLQKSVIIADSAEQKSIAEIRKMGATRIRASVKGADSVKYGISELQKYRIVISPDCEKLILELENYSWKKDKSTGEYINEAVDAFNHFIDALRYSLQCVRKYQELKTANKNILGL